MNRINRMKTKVGRLLQSHFPGAQSVRTDEWAIRNQSSTTYVNLTQGFGPDGVIMRVNSPLVYRVPIGSDLYRWVATEGQDHTIGHVYLVPSGEAGTCELWFGHNFAVNQFDETAILASIYPVIITSNDLDDRLLEQFGGRLAGDRVS